MLKKIVSLVVGTTLVLATLGVSAADVATTSTYNVADDTIAVTTNVTNANEGEVYTYLAYKLGTGGSLENLQNNEVVYVDEKVIATGETSTSFSYTTAMANDQAVVLLGNPTTDDTINGGVIEEGKTYRNYTIAVGAGEAEAAEPLDITGLAETTIVDIPAAIGSAVVTGVTVNGEAVDYIATNDGIKISLAALPENAVVVVEVAAGAQQAVVSIENAAFIPAANAADEDDAAGLDSIMVLAKIEGAASEYGIALGSSYENWVPVKTFKALGLGTGGYYAVRLYGFNQVEGLEEAATVWAKGYAVSDESTIYSDKVCGIKVGEADAAAEVIDAE